MGFKDIAEDLNDPAIKAKFDEHVKKPALPNGHLSRSRWLRELPICLRAVGVRRRR